MQEPAVSAVLRGPSSRSGVMIAPLGAWYGGEIPLFQDFAVVQLVAGDDEGQRTHGDFILIGASAAKPSLFAKRGGQRCSSAADQGELLGETGQGTFPKRAGAYVVVL